jgi:hypothetical protein
MDKVGNWVPQLFYDLIGRIIPGGLLLIIALIIFQDSLNIKQIFVSTTTTTVVTDTTTETTVGISPSALFLIATVVAYSLGALFGGIASITNRAFWRKNRSDITGKQDIDISYIYDYIQFHRPDIGSRLAKLSAERHMCRVIIVGMVILFIFYTVAAPAPYSSASFWITEFGLLLLGVSAFCLHRHITTRSTELMSNNWRLIHDAEKKPADPQPT